MKLAKTLQYVGYAGTALLAVLCFINGQYVFAIIMCLVLVIELSWFFWIVVFLSVWVIYTTSA